MKKLFISTYFCFFGIVLQAETLYSRTQTISFGDCVVYRTTFWGDNDTPTVNDDRYLGLHDVLDCSPGVNVPEDIYKYYYSPNGTDVDGTFIIPKDAKWIPYAEYNKKFIINQFKLGKIPSQVIPNDYPSYKIDVKEIKNE